MIIKNVENNTLIICVRCGYSMQPTSKSSLVSSMKKTTSFTKYIERKEEVVFDVPATAILDEKLSCSRCGHRGIYYWRKCVSSAESSDAIAKIFRCPKCGYTWTGLE